jgi:outer membrane lipoprotein-sorting protein
MKRFILLALVLVLICFSFTGCGGSKKETQNKPTESPAINKTTEKESAANLLGKGKEVKGMSYDYSLDLPDSKMMTGKVWMQGQKMKTEGTVEGKKIITIYDGDTNTVYTYYPDQNMAMKMSAPESGEKAPTPTDYTRNADPNKIKTLETTMYNGVKCKVMLIEGKEGKEQVKMWVREDYGIPVRVEATVPDGSKTVMEYKNLKVGPQSPGVFELPAGVKITDVNEMMKQMPQMPGSQQ